MSDNLAARQKELQRRIQSQQSDYTNKINQLKEQIAQVKSLSDSLINK
jgi:flagellar capping protein FliD